MRISIKNYKSIMEPISFDLPNFTVLTGENGSGKTHLFEAISNGHYSDVFIDGHQKIESFNIKYIAFNQLNPDVDEMSNAILMSQYIKDIWEELREAKKNFIHTNHYQPAPSIEHDIVYNSLYNQDTKKFIKAYCEKYKKAPLEIKEDDIRDNFKLTNLSNNNLFSSKLALIFKSYHTQYFDNLVNKVQKDEGITDGEEYLDKENFQMKYGEPPWDFVNSILERLNLPYQFNNPMGSRRETTFHLKLTHKNFGHELDTRDLSTGEKTLMSLALALYNTHEGLGHIGMLILDEPDAPLHPAMSKLMLEILEEDIVKKYSIPVVISTHSPTTIASAPAHSLFKITYENKKPVQCDLNDSVRLLSYGIPNLRVSIDSRRQVFVEHKYDVEYYESLFSILSRKHSFLTTPQFIPPHTHEGTNCSDVISITKALRDLGNTYIYGLIDWDKKNKKEDQVIVLGSGKRYAIENYLFEPHLVGLYLVKKNIINASDIGVAECYSYFDLAKRFEEDNTIVQQINDFIEAKVFLNIEDETKERVQSILINQHRIMINSNVCMMQGHELEKKYKSTWPQLNAIRGKGDSGLKIDIINTVINDFPDFLSQDILDTFKEFK